jgi:hypothetical protein
MIKPPKPKQWVLSRETQLESGEHHIDAIDSEGVPIRLCTKELIPGTHPLTNPEGDEK